MLYQSFSRPQREGTETVAMKKATVTFHRQVIRLCKGIIKAWEQWVDVSEYDNNVETRAMDMHSRKDKETADKFLSS